MTRTLIIMEKGVRAPLEEQYSHILWLARCLQWMQYAVDIMLQGEAVIYVRASSRAPVLELAGQRLDGMPDYGATLQKLAESGSTVFVRTRDWQKLCGSTESSYGQLIDGDKAARLLLAYEHVWYW
jgi:hypothetical protein